MPVRFASTLLGMHAIIQGRLQRAHDMVCVDECSGGASVRATLAGLSLALEPEPAHGLGFAQVVRA